MSHLFLGFLWDLLDQSLSESSRKKALFPWRLSYKKRVCNGIKLQNQIVWYTLWNLYIKENKWWSMKYATYRPTKFTILDHPSPIVPSNFSPKWRVSAVFISQTDFARKMGNDLSAERCSPLTMFADYLFKVWQTCNKQRRLFYTLGMEREGKDGGVAVPTIEYEAESSSFPLFLCPKNIKKFQHLPPSLPFPFS